MSNRKTYNSIVFLTVYLGLALVGASPQVFAQDSGILSQRTNTVKNRFSFQKQVKKEDCFEVSIAEIIELLAKYDANQIPVDFSYQVDYHEASPLNLKFLLAQGDKLFVDSLQKNITCSINLHKELLENSRSKDKSSEDLGKALLEALFPFTKVSYNYKSNNLEVTSNIIYTFANDNEAKNFAQFNQAAFEKNRKLNAPNLTRENRFVIAISSNSTIRYENNQVFVVTRLPRASIDEILAKNNAR